MSDFKAGSLSQVLDDLIKEHGIVDIITCIECLIGDSEAIARATERKLEARRWKTLENQLSDAARYAEEQSLRYIS